MLSETDFLSRSIAWKEHRPSMSCPSTAFDEFAILTNSYRIIGVSIWFQSRNMCVHMPRLVKFQLG